MYGNKNENCVTHELNKITQNTKKIKNRNLRFTNKTYSRTRNNNVIITV